MTDELVCERCGNVLVARLNRPEARNALNAALINGVGAVMNEAEADGVHREAGVGLAGR